MIRLECDYACGAHPVVLERLVATNGEATPGYGVDEHCQHAAQMLKDLCQAPDADVHFLVGGTQTNMTVIAAALRPHQGPISTVMGHINDHETGAVEATGHKILGQPSTDGKLTAAQIAEVCQNHLDDPTIEHKVQPGMVYISHPTEYGTLYSKAELVSLRALCDKYGMRLFLDGARLGYALASDGSDLTLPNIAELCDVFYIGGTKVGALFGEAVVFTNPSLGEAFFTEIKQHGALLAKGRMLGIQFDELFTDGLYEKIAERAIKLAMRIKSEMKAKGYRFYNDSYTNQQFPILSKKTLEALEGKVALDDWGPYGDKSDEMRLVRITTSWATAEDAVDTLLSLL